MIFHTRLIDYHANISLASTQLPSSVRKITCDKRVLCVFNPCFNQKLTTNTERVSQYRLSLSRAPSEMSIASLQKLSMFFINLQELKKMFCHCGVLCVEFPDFIGCVQFEHKALTLLWTLLPLCIRLYMKKLLSSVALIRVLPIKELNSYHPQTVLKRRMLSLSLNSETNVEVPYTCKCFFL